MDSDNVRVILAIDFGTTFSGFAYVHKANKEKVETNCTWPDREGIFKAPSVLQYDETYTKVVSWGETALVEEFGDWDDPESRHMRPIELFKLHISELKEHEKPWLPEQFDYKKAIEDYLNKMQELIKETLEKRWPGIQFPQQVGLVLTIPAEWPPNTTAIMRQCAYNAGLTTSVNSNHLEFTTEPEAAALHCIEVVKEHNLNIGDTFLVADCGGGTVDLTMRKLRPGNKLSELTERVGDLCGSTFVDKEFLQFLEKRVGSKALGTLKKDSYGQLQGLIQKFFCLRVKHRFNGDIESFKTIRLNLQRFCPDLAKYVTASVKTEMDAAGWIIKIDFEAVKIMFDPVVNRIIDLISDQLKASKEKCSAMFLVGGFSESPYLLRRVKEHFRDQDMTIAVPPLPIAAIVRGAVTYGLNIESISDRVLKWTYGIQIGKPFVQGKDKKRRRTPDGFVLKFHRMATRGANVQVNKKFWGEFVPLRFDQRVITFNIYYTRQVDGRYCDDPGMRLLGCLSINNPNINSYSNSNIEFSLTFGLMEIKANACNSKTKKLYDEVTFKFDNI